MTGTIGAGSPPAVKLAAVDRTRATADTPGLLVVQVDGLSHQHLQEALDRGLMPNMKRRMEEGKLSESVWHSGLPSQTVVVQAGVLYGQDVLCGNQWYDKTLKRIVNADGTGDTDEVERELQQHSQGLVTDGSTYLSPLSGGARRETIVLREIAEAKDDHGTRSQLACLARDFGHLGFSLALHPVQAVLTSARFAAHLAQGVVRRHKAHVPAGSLKEKVTAPVLASLNEIWFSDASARAMTRRMAKGDGVLFVDFPSFDENGHTYGVTEAGFKSLRNVDRNLEVLLKAAESSKRPYNVCLFSDHGHVSGVKFKDLYGQSLQEYVSTLTADTIVTQDFGSAAHIYFADRPGELDRSAVDAAMPGGVASMTAHDGIAFVVTRDGDATRIEGRQGSVRVAADGSVTVTGQNPLVPFGHEDRTVRQIHDMAHRAHAGDVIVFGEQKGDKFVDFSTSALRGLHGGIGGGQDEPFLAWTNGLHLDGEHTVKAGDLHRQLSR